MTEGRKYPGKLLLFGEYTAINGGDTLAIPFNKFYANWSYRREAEAGESSGLETFYQFLNTEMGSFFDLDEMMEENRKGLYLSSTIPVGYGLGSSGSVVAAVFDRFYLGKTQKDPDELLKIFQKMEAFFHGSSSGIDPLISYTSKAFHRKDGVLLSLEFQNLSLLNRLYLWDSGQRRSTENLVEYYKQKLEEVKFKKMVVDELVPLNNRIILSFIESDSSKFETSLEKLAELHQQYFGPMYPDKIIENLEKVITPADLKKICGAGGGGFYLIYLNDSNENHSALIEIT